MRARSHSEISCVFALFVSLGCGDAQPAKSAADESGGDVDESLGESTARSEASNDDQDDADSEAETEEEDVAGIPTQCAERSDDLCVPPGNFVRRLCDGTFADVALVMYQGPWSRGYLTGKVEAWNASGGASVQGWLEFDEEVLIVRARKPKAGGMQIEGQGTSYDVLRWNGSCATLEGGELTLNEPPSKKHSRVEWKWLGRNMQEVLREDDGINGTWRARRKECKGVAMGVVSKKCETLDKKLIDVIVSYVRDGGKLGEPEQMP